MVSVMLTLILLFCMEPTVMLVFPLPPALVLTQSPRVSMLPPKDLLPMLTMVMDWDTMVSVMLMLILLFSMVDMDTQLPMLDTPMPMVSLMHLTWDCVSTILVPRYLARWQSQYHS